MRSGRRRPASAVVLVTHKSHNTQKCHQRDRELICVFCVICVSPAQQCGDYDRAGQRPTSSVLFRRAGDHYTVRFSFTDCSRHVPCDLRAMFLHHSPTLASTATGSTSILAAEAFDANGRAVDRATRPPVGERVD